MTTIDNIMVLAYKLRDARTYECDVSEAVEAGKALRTALTELTSTATEYQQAADKMAMEHKVERDTLRQQLAEAQALIEASREQEPVYAFRRKGLDDFCTCSEKRFLELSRKQNLFEVKKLYAAPVVTPEVLKEIERKNEALLNIARKAEALKRECGDDPESQQAIRNGRYMHLSYLARAAMGGAND